MNPEALDEAYKLFVSQGYRGGKSDFYNLLGSNKEALKGSYDLFVSQGYKGSQDQYAELLGVGMNLEVGPKKKDSTGLPSVDSSLDSPSRPELNLTTSQSIGFVQEEPEQALSELSALADSLIDLSLVNQNETNIKNLLNDNFGRYGFVFEESDPGIDRVIARTVDGKQSFTLDLMGENLKYTGGAEAHINRFREFIRQNGQPGFSLDNEDYLTKVQRVRDMRPFARVNPNGSVSTHKLGTFEADGKYYVAPTIFPANPNFPSTSPRDWIEPEDPLGVAFERGEAVEFDSYEEAERFAQGEWKNINMLDYEASQLFAERGLDYINLRRARDEYDRVSDRIDEIRGSDISEQVRKKVDDVGPLTGSFLADAFTAASIKGNEEELAELERQQENLAQILFADDAVRETFDDWSVVANKRGVEKARESYLVSQAIEAELDLVNQHSLVTFGVPVTDIPTLDFADEEARQKADQVYTAHQLILDSKQYADDMMTVAESYFDSQTNKLVNGEFEENLSGVLNEINKGWATGQAGWLVTAYSLGIDPVGYDLDKPEDQERLAEEISRQMMKAQGGSSRVLSGFNNSRSTSEWLEYAKDDPFELMTSWVANSASMMLPLGLRLVPAGVVAGGLAGAAYGALAGALFGGAGAGPGALAGLTSGGIQGGRTAFALANFGIEYFNAFFEKMTEKGMNPMNPQEVLAAMRDEQHWAETREQGLKRGIPIAAVDYLSANLAGRVFARPLASTPKRLALLGAEQLAFGPGSEAFGEYLAQVSAGQEVSIKDIIAEAGGALGNNSANLALNTWMQTRGNYVGRLANQLATPEYVSSNGASPRRMIEWAERMHSKGKITDQQKHDIERTVGTMREANKAMTGSEAPKKRPNTKVRARVMSLMQAREKLAERGETTFSASIQQINEEIEQTLLTGKVNKQGFDVGAVDTRLKERDSQFRYKGKVYEREQFEEAISQLTDDELLAGIESGDVVIPRTLEGLEFIQSRLDAIQEPETAEVPARDEPTTGEEVGEEVQQPTQEEVEQEEVTPQAEPEVDEGVADEQEVDDIGAMFGEEPIVTPEPEALVEPEQPTPPAEPKAQAEPQKVNIFETNIGRREYAKSREDLKKRDTPPSVPPTPPVGSTTESIFDNYTLEESGVDDISTYQQQDEIDQELVDKYADWIAQGFELPPVVAIRMSDGSLRISDGHHRLLAAKKAGLDSVKVWVSEAKKSEAPVEPKAPVEPETPIEPEAPVEPTPPAEPEVEPEAPVETEDPFRASEEDTKKEAKNEGKWRKTTGGYEFRDRKNGKVYTARKTDRGTWELREQDWDGTYSYGGEGAKVVKGEIFANTTDPTSGSFVNDDFNKLSEVKDFVKKENEAREAEEKKKVLERASRVLRESKVAPFEGDINQALEVVRSAKTMTELFDKLLEVIGEKAVDAIPVYEAIADNAMLDEYQREIARSIVKNLKESNITTFFSLNYTEDLPDGTWLTASGIHRMFRNDFQAGMLIVLQRPRNTYAAMVSGDRDNYDGSRSLITMLHEGLHAATKPKMLGDNRFANEMRGLFKEVKDYLEKNEEKYKNKHKIYNTYLGNGSKNRGNNSLQDAYELLAWGLTDPDMQALLKDIPVEREVSAWDRFVDNVRRLLGLPDRPQITNALEALIDAYASMNKEADEAGVPSRDVDQTTRLLDEKARIESEIELEKNALKGNLADLRDQYKGAWSKDEYGQVYTLNNGTRFLLRKSGGEYTLTTQEPQPDGTYNEYTETFDTVSEAKAYIKEAVTETRDEALEDFRDEAKSIIDDLKEELKEVNKELKRLDSQEMSEGGTPLAPNGKPSKLTPELHALVRTPEFKEWFGDWENDPENASKVVDENGEPLVVYHGSPKSDITTFEPGHTASGMKEFGWHFTTNPKLARLYANNRARGLDGRVYPVFLNIRNITEFDAEGKSFDQGAWRKLEAWLGYKWATGTDAQEALSGNNTAAPDARVDGVKASNIIDMAFPVDNEFLGDGYVVWFDSPQNVKLADGTNETFDNSSLSIQEMREGPVAESNAQSVRAVIAPFFDTTFNTVDEAVAARDSQEYRDFIASLEQVASSLGMKANVQSGIGGYTNEAGKSIVELSTTVTLEDANIDQAVEYAAIFGAIAPEVQEATIAAQYVEEGSENHNANEYEFVVSDLDAAIQALKKAGIQGFSIDNENNVVSVIDVLDFSDPELQKKLGTFASALASKGISYEAKGYRAVDSRYIDKESRQAVIRRLQEEGSSTGQNRDVVRSLVNEAVKRDAKFRGVTENKYLGKKAARGNRLFNEPLPEVAEIADRYYERVFGGQRPRFKGTKELDVARAKRIAKAFKDMKVRPNDPDVREAYDAMSRETLEQYEAMLEAGFVIEVNNEDAYGNSAEMIEDLRTNRRLKIFSTESGFGSSGITEKMRKENPLLAKTKYKDANGKPLLVNDIFRGVHDFFGHAELGNSFGPKGEENAWNVHVRMYSPLAARAMTTETRGQNSYVNFSGVNDRVNKMREQAARLRERGLNDEAAAIVEKVYEEIAFADQKVGLLPEEFWSPDVDDQTRAEGGLEVQEMSEGAFNAPEGDNIFEIVYKARQAGFSDAAIREHLKRRGVSAADIKNALAVPLDISTQLPPAFGNVPGGVIVGQRIYSDVRAQVDNYIKAYQKKNKELPTYQQIREAAQQFLNAHEEFQKFDSTLQDELRLALDKGINPSANKKLSAELKAIKDRLRQRAIGRAEVKQVQGRLIKFLKANMPTGVANKAKVNRLLGLLKDVNEGNLPVIMSEAMRVLDDLAKDSKLTEKVNALKEQLKDKQADAKTLQRAKVEARIFIRKHMPVSKYGKQRVARLIKLATDATPDTLKDGKLTENSISNVFKQVMVEVTRQRVKDLLSDINNAVKTSTTKTVSGRVKGRMLPEAQERLARIKDMITDPKKELDAKNKLEELRKRFDELSSKDALTPTEVDELADVEVGIKYNEAILSEDSDVNKVALLEEVVAEVNAVITGARSEFKEAMKAQREYYNSLKSQLFKDVTGGMEVDFNDSEAVNEAMREIERMGLKEEKRNVAIRAIKKVFSGLDMLFIGRSDAKENMLDRISHLPGEMFGGVAKELILDRINESSRQHKAGRIAINRMLEDKAKQIFGKDYKSVMTKNGVQTETYSIDPAKTRELEQQLEAATDKRERRRIEREIYNLEKPISQNEMYYLYNQFKDEANHPGFQTKFNKQYVEIMAEIESKLDPKVREWADWQVNEFFPSVYERYNSVYREIYRTNMPYNENYAGRIIREVSESDKKKSEDMMKSMMSDEYRTAVGGNSTKMRKQNSNAIVTRNGDTALSSYVNEMEFFRSYAVNMRDIIKMVYSGEISKAIEVTAGKDVYGFLKRMIQTVLTSEMTHQDNVDSINTLLNSFVTSKLAFNPTLFLKQATSAVAFSDYIGYATWTKYLAKGMAGGVFTFNKHWKEMFENSPVLQDRYGHTNIGAMLDNFQGSTALPPLTVAGKVIKSSEIKDKTIEALMVFVKYGDMAGVMGSIPNYLYYKEQFMKKHSNATEQAAIEYAIRKVEDQVNSTQQSPDPQYKDVTQTGNPALRFLSMFQSSPRALVRKETYAIRQLYRKMRGRGSKGTLGQNLRTLFTYHVAIPVLFQYVANGFFGMLRPADEEEDREDLLRAAIIGNWNAVFVLGELIGITADYIQDKPWAGDLLTIPIFVVSRDFAKSLNMAVEYNKKAEKLTERSQRDKRAEYEQKAQDEFISAILTLTEASGIPANNINKLIDNYSKVLDEPDGGKAILRLLNYSEYTIQRGTPEEKERGKMNKSDMKRYFPEMYNSVYGPDAPGADMREQQREIDRELREMQRETKDRAFGKD